MNVCMHIHQFTFKKQKKLVSVWVTHNALKLGAKNPYIDVVMLRHWKKSLDIKVLTAGGHNEDIVTTEGLFISPSIPFSV